MNELEAALQTVENNRYEGLRQHEGHQLSITTVKGETDLAQLWCDTCDDLVLQEAYRPVGE